MITNRYARSAIALAFTLTLAACGVPYEQQRVDANNAYPATVQANNTVTASSYYRGTASGVAATNNDAAINANVLATLSRMTTQGATNLQASTFNGVVTLRGTANTSVDAQNTVQAVRQVPGVQRVDYDIQVLRP